MKYLHVEYYQSLLKYCHQQEEKKGKNIIYQTHYPAVVINGERKNNSIITGPSLLTFHLYDSTISLF